MSTKDSNLFKAPFMLPFAALDKRLCPPGMPEKDRPRCMLRYGVVNVMAMERIDMLYEAANLSIDQENCQGEGKNCEEVNIKIQRLSLKGLSFNRFVTDSNHNIGESGVSIGVDVEADNNGVIIKSEARKDVTPGCDFLLHDGRACDVIEAAYLHDGPAIKALGVIEGLNALRPEKLESLRAFLYSL